MAYYDGIYQLAKIGNEFDIIEYMIQYEGISQNIGGTDIYNEEYLSPAEKLAFEGNLHAVEVLRNLGASINYIILGFIKGGHIQEAVGYYNQFQSEIDREQMSNIYGRQSNHIETYKKNLEKFNETLSFLNSVQQKGLQSFISPPGNRFQEALKKYRERECFKLHDQHKLQFEQIKKLFLENTSVIARTMTDEVPFPQTRQIKEEIEKDIKRYTAPFTIRLIKDINEMESSSDKEKELERSAKLKRIIDISVTTRWPVILDSITNIDHLPLPEDDINPPISTDNKSLQEYFKYKKEQQSVLIRLQQQVELRKPIEDNLSQEHLLLMSISQMPNSRPSLSTAFYNPNQNSNSNSNSDVEYAGEKLPPIESLLNFQPNNIKSEKGDENRAKRERISRDNLKYANEPNL